MTNNIQKLHINSSILDPAKVYSPSYGWRSIVSARPLVNKRLIKRVGSGASISVWNDPRIPAQFPRPAKSNGSFIDLLLKVNSLIDLQTNNWDLAKLIANFERGDVETICGIPLGSRNTSDTLEWHFTKTEKYTVKSGYHTMRVGHLQTSDSRVLGPELRPLMAYTWKVTCPPKLKHFMWQIITGCVAVSSNLRNRGIDCDASCARCGEVETVNHALFECPPTLQTWALSQIPTAHKFFPSRSVYTNMDYLFWKTPKESNSIMFSWLLWYIWKARNENVYEGIDKDPRDVVSLAEAEEKTWTLAQHEENIENITLGERGNQIIVRDELIGIRSGVYRCFVDGSWKEGEKFSGMGWCCDHQNVEMGSMGAANLRRSLTFLHSEVEALIWVMRCMIGQDKREIVFLTDCSDLVKMISSPGEWPAFAIYLEAIKSDQHEFDYFSVSLIPHRVNVRADKLARYVRAESQLSTFVNNIPRYWFI